MPLHWPANEQTPSYPISHKYSRTSTSEMNLLCWSHCVSSVKYELQGGNCQMTPAHEQCTTFIFKLNIAENIMPETFYFHFEYHNESCVRHWWSSAFNRHANHNAANWPVFIYSAIKQTIRTQMLHIQKCRDWTVKYIKRCDGRWKIQLTLQILFSSDLRWSLRRSNKAVFMERIEMETALGRPTRMFRSTGFHTIVCVIWQ